MFNFKKITKQIIAFLFALSIAVLTILSDFNSVKSYSIDFEPIDPVWAGSPEGYLFGFTYNALSGAGKMLSDYILSSTTSETREEILDNLKKAVKYVYSDGVAVDVADVFLSKENLLILATYLDAKSKAKYEESINAFEGDGVYLSDVAEKGSQIEDIKPAISTKLWTDMKQQYYQDVKNTDEYINGEGTKVDSSLASNPWYEALKYYSLDYFPTSNPSYVNLYIYSPLEFTNGKDTYKAIFNPTGGSDNDLINCIYGFSKVGNYHIDAQLSEYSRLYVPIICKDNSWYRLCDVYLDSNSSLPTSFKITQRGSYFDCFWFNNGNSSRGTAFIAEFNTSEFSISYDGLFFNSLEDANSYFSSIIAGAYDDSYIANNPSVIVDSLGYKDLIDDDVISKIFDGKQYVTQEELEKIKNIDYKNYSTTNEYVTDARQYITNNVVNEGDTTINEGDTIINSTYDDSNLLSKLADWFNQLILRLTFILEAIRTWNFVDWWEYLKEYITKIFLNVNVIALTLNEWFSKWKEWDLEDWFKTLTLPVTAIAVGIDTWLDDEKEWKFAEWWLTLDGYLKEWHFADWYLDFKEKFEEWTFADWFGDILAKLNEWTFADWFREIIELLKKLLGYGWLEDVLNGIKELAKVLDLADVLATFFDIDTNAISEVAHLDLPMPDGFNDFSGLFVEPIKVRYSSVNYPVFKIQTPDVIKPYYKSGDIVLYDTSDHSELFSKVRAIIAFCLYFGLVMYIIKAFKGTLEIV